MKSSSSTSAGSPQSEKTKVRTAAIKEKALQLGFSKVGIAPAAAPGEEAARLEEWLHRGYHGSMSWMARDTDRRTDLQAIVPGARTVISLGVNYYTTYQHSAAPGSGKISRYAWGDDYHAIIRKRLKAFWNWLEKEYHGAKGKYYVDTGPVMEKVWAQKAGLGWIGKHTNLITQEFGSWVFLGQVITTLDLECDLPATDHCGSCSLCIEACPTQAIVEPYVLDATLCISYLTIEHKGDFEGAAGEGLDRWIFGCDVCQDVCPWNHKFSVDSEETAFAPRPWNREPDLKRWEGMTEQQFEEWFKGSPVKRAGYSGLRRSIRAALRPSSPAMKAGGTPDTGNPASHRVPEH